MKNLYTKIVLFTILGISILSCSVTKNLESNSLILRSNKILVNKSEISADSLLPLIVQKKNNYFYADIYFISVQFKKHQKN